MDYLAELLVGLAAPIALVLMLWILFRPSGKP
jgi:hypothetical protein